MYWHGFIRSADGTITTFDVSGAQDTFANAMNDHGVVAGYYEKDVNQSYGFVRAADGTITTLDIDGANFVQILALNADEVIIGNYDTDIQHGFVESTDGEVTTFDPKHSIDTWPGAINASGDIAGWYWDGGKVHGFLRTP